MSDDGPTDDDAAAPPVAGTVQLRPGAAGPDRAIPLQATLTGPPPTSAAAPAMPGPPSTRYELGAEIARGGMGRVVEARDGTLGRTVALKEALAGDAEALRRFQREIRITARLEHPSIVPVHDAGIGPGGMPFYVMRKIGGRPLEKLVKTGTSLAERLALLPHVLAATHAIAHAHARGIIHRDIKPSNILVGELGETIVIDWGLAKAIDDPDDDPASPTASTAASASRDPIQTRAGTVFGTPGFMAPEQLAGHPADRRCDVYALGATLYHLLGRQPPHHAASAEAMMRAAVDAPPPSIGALVPGVPPELSTIVDKALAYEADHRYPDASALAEDLQRFLTGQLVASHHYSARARLVRWLQANRRTVAVASVLVAALGVGGVVSVRRIVRERDRADAAAIAARVDQQRAEAERERAEVRTDQLALSQAATIARTDPTAAIAMLKPLAGSPRWRDVLAVAAAARAAGVAWRLPASPVTRSLELSRDGQRAVAAGEDGVVRIYDLRARTARVVAELGAAVTAHYADSERQLVVWSPTTLVVLDVATGARRDITPPTRIRALAITGAQAAWVDAAGDVWQLDLAGTHPLQVPTDEPIHALAPSPDGRWLALAGAQTLLVLDRQQPALPPHEITAGLTSELAWARDSSHLAALVGDLAVDVAMADPPQIVQRVTVGRRARIVVSGMRVYTLGATGVAVMARDSSGARRPLTGAPVGLAEGPHGAIIAGSDQAIAVLSERGDRTLGIPGGRRLSQLVATPSATYIVGAAPAQGADPGHLLIWDLAEFEPDELATGVASAHPAGPHHVLATFADGPAKLLPVDRGDAQVLGDWPAVLGVAAAPTSGMIAVVDHAHTAHLLMPGQPPREIATEVDAAVFASDAELVLRDSAGTLRRVSVRGSAATAAPSVLLTRPVETLACSRSGPARCAAVLKDGTVWRTNLTTGATSELPPGALGSTGGPPPPDAASRVGSPTPVEQVSRTLRPGPLLVEADGTVVVALERALRAWRPDGTVSTLATLAGPIVALDRATVRTTAPGGDRLLVRGEQGTAAVVDLAPPHRVTNLEDSVASTALVADTGLLVEPRNGALRIVDPLITARQRAWILAEAPNATYLQPAIAPDGSYLIALAAGRLLRWHLPSPRSQAETKAWLETLTNVTSEVLQPPR